MVHQHGRQYGCHDVMCMRSISHFLVAFCLCLKTSPRAKSYENLLRLQLYFHANNLRKKSFERRLVLKQRQKELGNGPNLDCVQSYFLESLRSLGATLASSLFAFVVIPSLKLPLNVRLTPSKNSNSKYWYGRYLKKFIQNKR